MREILVVSYVTLAIVYLVVTLEPVRVMEAGVAVNKLYAFLLIKVAVIT